MVCTIACYPSIPSGYKHYFRSMEMAWSHCSWKLSPRAIASMLPFSGLFTVYPRPQLILLIPCDLPTTLKALMLGNGHVYKICIESLRSYFLNIRKTIGSELFPPATRVSYVEKSLISSGTSSLTAIMYGLVPLPVTINAGRGFYIDVFIQT